MYLKVCRFGIHDETVTIITYSFIRVVSNEVPCTISHSMSVVDMLVQPVKCFLVDLLKQPLNEAQLLW